ncbi:hypothetical protein QTL54_27970, partial [Klebsiella michiganensis]
AARFGVDAFITGEVSEQTIHSARSRYAPDGRTGTAQTASCPAPGARGK